VSTGSNDYSTLSDGSLTSATSFSHLLNLENLDISYNKVESLSRTFLQCCLILIEANGFLRLELECLRHLRELRADGNLIRSLDGLQRMHCLVKLSLQRNHIVEMDFTQGSWCAFLPYRLYSGNTLLYCHFLSPLSHHLLNPLCHPSRLAAAWLCSILSLMVLFPKAKT
jgi:Leucine-rich repeat (LRR) protein